MEDAWDCPACGQIGSMVAGTGTYVYLVCSAGGRHTPINWWAPWHDTEDGYPPTQEEART